MLSVFVKIETLVDEKVREKNIARQIWHKFVTKPSRAESLVVQLDREVQLFQVRYDPNHH